MNADTTRWEIIEGQAAVAHGSIGQCGAICSSSIRVNPGAPSGPSAVNNIEAALRFGGTTRRNAVEQFESRSCDSMKFFLIPCL